MTDNEYLFMCLLAVCLQSSGKCQSRYFFALLKVSFFIEIIKVLSSGNKSLIRSDLQIFFPLLWLVSSLSR